MAGITAADLTAPVGDEISELLGGSEISQKVDLSAVDTVAKKTATSTDVEIPDDLLDFD